MWAAKGSGNAAELAKRDNIIALCDVDEAWHKTHIKPHESLHKAKLWTDYRRMFDKIGDEIDAVCVATPEHNHYTISMAAIRRGKHVYCQKPLCHTVNEVRLLTEEAKKHPKVITQMGHQGHSSRSSANIRDLGPGRFGGSPFGKSARTHARTTGPTSPWRRLPSRPRRSTGISI